jgi:hypothetical protein
MKLQAAGGSAVVTPPAVSTSAATTSQANIAHLWSLLVGRGVAYTMAPSAPCAPPHHDKVVEVVRGCHEENRLATSYARGRRVQQAQHACSQGHTVQCSPPTRKVFKTTAATLMGGDEVTARETVQVAEPSTPQRRQRYCMCTTECRTCRHHQRGTEMHALTVLRLPPAPTAAQPRRQPHK